MIDRYSASINACFVGNWWNRVPFDTPAAAAILAVDTPIPSEKNTDNAAARIPAGGCMVGRGTSRQYTDSREISHSRMVWVGKRGTLRHYR